MEYMAAVHVSTPNTPLQYSAPLLSLDNVFIRHLSLSHTQSSPFSPPSISPY